MKNFYLFDGLDFSPNKECRVCPHRHNSLLIANSPTPNVLERFEVRYDWCVRSKKYPTYDIARSAFEHFCKHEVMFKRRRRCLSITEYFELTMRYPTKFIEDKCFINNDLFAEIVRLF